LFAKKKLVSDIWGAVGGEEYAPFHCKEPFFHWVAISKVSLNPKAANKLAPINPNKKKAINTE
jgi:hypothetical protein